MRSLRAANTPLAIIVPVESIDAQAIDRLAGNAHAAPALEFVAVGKRLKGGRSGPKNLTIIDADCSLYQAMNEGLVQARTEYVLFMGMDDRVLNGYVEPLLRALAEVPRDPLIALPVMLGMRLKRIRPSTRRPVAFHHQGVLFQRRAALHLGGYSNQYQLHADLDLMFRLQGLGPAGWIDVPLVEFRRGGLSTSGANAMTSLREFNRIYVEHGVSRLDEGYLVSVAYLLWFRARYSFRSLVPKREAGGRPG